MNPHPIALEQSLRASWPDEWPVVRNTTNAGVLDRWTTNPEPVYPAADPLQLPELRNAVSWPQVSESWHSTFGEVKCWNHRWCHVCSGMDWPLASWIQPDPIRPPETDEPWPDAGTDLLDASILGTAVWAKAITLTAAALAVVLIAIAVRRNRS